MKVINCILLVDDNPADNEYHKIIIKESNLCKVVKVATNGHLALEYLRKAGEPNPSIDYPKPDLIYLDINMPVMNGFEFLEEYHKLDESLKSKIVIVMLSTSLHPNDKNKALQDNEVTKFQNKPLTVEMIKFISEKYF